METVGSAVLSEQVLTAIRHIYTGVPEAAVCKGSALDTWQFFREGG